MQRRRPHDSAFGTPWCFLVRSLSANWSWPCWPSHRSSIFQLAGLSIFLALRCHSGLGSWHRSPWIFHEYLLNLAFWWKIKAPSCAPSDCTTTTILAGPSSSLWVSLSGQTIVMRVVPICLSWSSDITRRTRSSVGRSAVTIWISKLLLISLNLHLWSHQIFEQLKTYHNTPQKKYFPFAEGLV